MFHFRSVCSDWSSLKPGCLSTIAIPLLSCNLSLCPRILEPRSRPWLRNPRPKLHNLQPQTVPLHPLLPNLPKASPTSSILRMIEPIPMADSLSSPLRLRAPCQAGRPRGGRSASPSRQSSSARATSPSRSPASRGNGRFGLRTPGRLTHWGSLPSEGHREAPCAVVLQRSRGVGRCPPGSDARGTRSSMEPRTRGPRS
jgi:hypothetical protein